MMPNPYPWYNERTGTDQRMIFDYDRGELKTERLPGIGLVGKNLAGFVCRDAHVRPNMDVVADSNTAGAPKHRVRAYLRIIADFDESGMLVPAATGTVEVSTVIDENAFPGEKLACAEQKHIVTKDHSRKAIEQFLLTDGSVNK